MFQRTWARSRKRYPANEAEARAVAFIVQCRSRSLPITFEEITRLLETHYPGLGRGPGGSWSRYLVQRIAKRAGATNPGLVPHKPRPHRGRPRKPTPAIPRQAPPAPRPEVSGPDWTLLERVGRALSGG